LQKQSPLAVPDVEAVPARPDAAILVTACSIASSTKCPAARRAVEADAPAVLRVLREQLSRADDRAHKAEEETIRLKAEVIRLKAQLAETRTVADGLEERAGAGDGAARAGRPLLTCYGAV
jgi:hypothetical protein